MWFHKVILSGYKGVGCQEEVDRINARCWEMEGEFSLSRI